MTHSLYVQAHVVGIVWMDGILLPWLDISQRVSGAYRTPCCPRSPSVTFRRTELERSVLDKLGTQAAVGRHADILKEDSDKFVTDFLAAGRRLDGLGCTGPY